MAVGTAPTSVFDADLPTLAYGAEESPAEVYPRLQAAQRQAPVAIGPHGPEVLSYHLVRSVLRDAPIPHPAKDQSVGPGRHVGPPVGQGDQQPAVPGRRRAPSAAQPDVQGVHAPCDPAAARHHGRGDERAGGYGHRRGSLRRRRRPRAPLPRPDHLRIARRSARGLATVLVVGGRRLQGLQLQRRPPRSRARRHDRVAPARRLRRRHGRAAAAQPDR